MKKVMRGIVVTFSMLLVFFMFAIKNVEAVEANDIFIKRFTTSEVVGALTSYSSNGRSAFFGEGVVTTVKVKSKLYNLYYYDMNGKLINKAELTDIGVVYYMEEHDNFLYVSSDDYLFKFDSNLNKVAELKIETFLPNSGAHGTKNIFFEKDKIILYDEDYSWNFGMIYTIDYDLKSATKVAHSYNSPDEYAKYAGYLRDLNRSSLPVKISYDMDGGILELTSGYTGKKTDEIKSASLSIIKKDSNGEEVFNKTIINEDYYEFYVSRVVDNYIITVASKFPDSIMKVEGAMVSDILIYDLEGNYIETIVVDKIINYLNAFEDKFVFATQVYDGVCEESKYFYDGCDILTNISVYSLPLPEVPKEEPSEEIKNPETAAFLINHIFIISMLIMGIGSIVIANKSFRKIRSLR